MLDGEIHIPSIQDKERTNQIVIESNGDSLNTHVFFVDDNGFRHEIRTVKSIAWSISADSVSTEATVVLLSPEISIKSKANYVLVSGTPPED